MNAGSKSRVKKAALGAILLLLFPFSWTQGQSNPTIPVEVVEKDFKALLKRPSVAFRPSFSSIQTDTVLIEKGFIYSEKNEMIPILIYKPVIPGMKSFPVVISHHGTGGNKEQADIKSLLYRFSKKGILAVVLDSRYHGERIKGGATNKKEYVEAITSAWQNTGETIQKRPFFFDTVYDIWRLTDYLVTRPDVQSNRIGMVGISMGGIETWMAASVDKRIKVAVPIIAAQSFKWSLENDHWQGRARTIWAAHEQAAKDLGDSIVKKENVKVLWEKVAPGITEKFDCPSMIRLFAPRPLLLLNTEKDLNCPLPGAELAFEAATNAYQAQNSFEKLKIHVTPTETHRLTPEHVEMTIDWISRWL